MGKKLQSVEQTSFTDQFYYFGSVVVQKRKLNYKPKVAVVEELMCSDGILYREGVFCDWKGMLNCYRAASLSYSDQTTMV